MNYTYAMLAAALSLGGAAHAQQQPWREGEIEAEQVVIVKERENELPPATRSYQKIPPQQPRQDTRTVTIRPTEPMLSLRPLQPTVRVLRMQQDPPAPYFQRYVKAGIGNYVSPLLEAHLSSPRQAAFLYNLQLRHESAARGPVGGSRSAWGENSLRAEGSLIGKAVRFTGGGWYSRNRYHFYGFDDEVIEPGREEIKQIYNRAGVKAVFENVSQEKLVLNSSVSVSRTGTSRDAVENKAELEGKIQYALSDLLGLHIQGSLLTGNYEDVTSRNRSLFRLLPGFSTQFGPLSITGGFTFAWENDTVSNADKLHFFPRAEVSVAPSQNFRAYTGIRGDVLPVTYDFISQQNPFLNDRIPLLFTQKTLEFYGGLTASLPGGFGAAAGFSAANLKNMHFFVNSAQDTTRFDVLYDQGNTGYVNVYGQLSFARSERFGVQLRTDVFNYSPSSLAEPWHLPALKVEADVRYNIYDKIYLNADAYVLSGIKARTIGTENGVTELDPIINLGLGGEYRFSPQATAFLNFHNLLGKEFERFQNYPSRKLLVRLGATYAF
ncbi:TonB-dependent receptor [Cesiribacter andamanensis]|uniref:Outer membrane cobalamin receptor protein n=1 Tax=Cesiribacter andamanensis AMV16 TaxID=1279009 RepID=M7NM81_9BACT|nr:hypothetical protein [Cesiribacter andamanensis]EMR02890.1 hypothetical protein ADICEAN_01984 [Cesiribacter andamanensis AMV16]